MNLISWSPFRELDSLFDRYAREFRNGNGAVTAGDMQWKPSASITENNKEYTIKADLPEVERKDIDVKVENGVLTITGERRLEKSTDDEKEHRRETYYGSFARSFSLPEDVNDEAIRAESKNGVLVVHLPKTKAHKPAAVSIEVK